MGRLKQKKLVSNGSLRNIPGTKEKINNDTLSDVTFEQFTLEDYPEFTEVNNPKEETNIISTVSLPEQLAELIHSNSTFIFNDLINQIKYDDLSILIGGSNNDKRIFLETIMIYLEKYTELSFFEKQELVSSVAKIYDIYNIITFKGDEIPFYDILLRRAENSFWFMYNMNIFDNYIDEIKFHKNNNLRLSPELLSLLKIQMFIFASPFLNLDTILENIEL